MADLNAFNARQKYSHFSILVIGRANAGKTTLLKRVCNTTEDPRIYNKGMNLVRFLSSRERKNTLTVPWLETRYGKHSEIWRLTHNANRNNVYLGEF